MTEIKTEQQNRDSNSGVLTPELLKFFLFHWQLFTLPVSRFGYSNRYSLICILKYFS